MLTDQEEAGSNGLDAEQMTVEFKGVGFFLVVIRISVTGHPFWTAVCGVSSSKHLPGLIR